MALEDNGFTIKRYDEIRQEINEDFSTNAGVSIDTSSDSIANVVNSIQAKQLAELWELGEGINDSSDVLKAEGQALDNLALQVGLTRLPAQKSAGIAYFTGDNGTSISTSAIMSTAKGDNFNPVYEVLISPASCLTSLLTINLVLEEVIYQVSVNGTQYNYTSQKGDTSQEIVDELLLELANGSDIFSAVGVEEDSFRITINSEGEDDGDTLNISGTTYITFSEITSVGVVQSVELGAIEGSAYTLTFINTPINGWGSVNNPTDLAFGRSTQTDEELRTAILNNFEIKDSCTYQGIKNALETVEGVTSVDIFENTEFSTQLFNDTPVKGKSYMCTLDGGVKESIAQVIWDTKPAGIPTSGSESVTITDDDGQEHVVNFSRSVKEYFYIKISYSLYTEEDFPTGGEELIKESCLNYGNTLGIGVDVIPQRFEGAIFDDVSGIDSITVSVANSTDPALDVNDPSLVYTTSRVPMDTTQSPLFGTNRMEVTLD